MGLKGSVTSELFFENCRHPAENLLGKENEGFRQFLTTLDAGRVAIAAMALGLAHGAFERAVAYAKQHVQFGQPIANFQAIQWMIADMATEIDAAAPDGPSGHLVADEGSPVHQGGLWRNSLRRRSRTSLLEGYPDSRGLRVHSDSKWSGCTGTGDSALSVKGRTRFSAWSSHGIS
ncbi:MAG: acyl-CoA dehydrogenase family protein [Anaerolineae bacterium]|nr:acyl-CoA dehydrogenase family protein [Anaerolineae bacterium]